MSPSPPTDAERFWSAHLVAIERGGASVAQYAREHDLSAPSLYRWRRRLGSRSAAASFAEVRVTAPPPVPPSDSSGLALTLALGTAQLAFAELPPPAWLADLLAAERTGR